MPFLFALAALTASMPDNGFDLAGRSIIARFHAEGAQIYACTARPEGGAPLWTLREPIATLIEDGKTVGRHFAGPRWELDDGSMVQGHVEQSLPGATAQDIPALKLTVVQNRGNGRLAQATFVYRLATQGGALAGACDTPGALRAVPYAADYLFTR